MYYVDNCALCDEVKPFFQSIAKQAMRSETLLFGQINLSLNEVFELEFDTLPVFYFYSRDDTTAIKFEPRHEAEFNAWLSQYNSGHYFVDPLKHKQVIEDL